jgi:plastocyanin
VRWTRVAVLGLLLCAVGAALLVIAISAFGLNPEERPFLLVVGALALLGAWLVWRFGWWGKVVGIVAGVAMVMTLFWTAFGLQSFPSFFDFMPAVLVVPGAVLALVGCISALVAGRRGHLSEHATGGERATVRAALGVVVLLAVVSGVLTLVSRSTVGAANTEVVVKMKSFKFDRKTYTVRAGAEVLVRNDDPFVHTFTVDALQIDERTNPGDTLLVAIPDKPGTYVLYCDLHVSSREHPTPDDMASRLVVQ